jgi:hypothetical protein
MAGTFMTVLQLHQCMAAPGTNETSSARQRMSSSAGRADIPQRLTYSRVDPQQPLRAERRTVTYCPSCIRLFSVYQLAADPQRPLLSRLLGNDLQAGGIVRRTFLMMLLLLELT